MVTYRPLRVTGGGDELRCFCRHGLDASEAMLARARHKLRDVELVLGRAEQLPYPEATFVPLAKIAADIERRELSQLAIRHDGAYQRGLARVRADLAADPHAREVSEVALLCCTARPRAREQPRPA